MKKVIFWCGALLLLFATLGAAQKPQILSPTSIPNPGPAALTLHYSQLASVSRNNNCIDLFGIKSDGSVSTTRWNQSVDKFSSSALAAAGSASVDGGITAQSRYEGTVEVWWIGQDGVVNGAYWYEGNNWKFYKFEPSKGFAKAAVKGGISCFHRTRDELFVTWIAENGSIQGAYWGGTGDWYPNSFLSTAGSASTAGDITAVSRTPDTYDLFWIASDGSIKGRFFNGVKVIAANSYTIPNSGNADLKAPLDGHLFAASRSDYLTVFWISTKGGVRQSYWTGNYSNGKDWQTHAQPIANNAQPNGSLSVLMRIPTSSEVWYAGKDGGVKAAYWYDGSSWWKEYELSPAGLKASAIAAVSRMPNALEVFWAFDVLTPTGDNDLKSANFYEDLGEWKKQAVSQFYPRKMLWGFADLHTHPMSNLGFGGKLIHGVPDVGSLMPVNFQCDHQVRAPNIQVALADCDATHGGWNMVNNTCGDVFRNTFIVKTEEGNAAQSKHGKAFGGANTMFKEWPAWNDITHQTMWVDWLRRTYGQGLRVMVALAVNNQTLAAGVSGPDDGPVDDKGSADLQIDEIRSFVGRHNDFMKIARSPEEVRSIVWEGKLAVIIGVEVDNIGNFNALAKSGQTVTENMVAAEIQRLYDKDVRYIFPIHVTDNPFGGAALYNDAFAMSNAREFGKCFQLDCALPGDGIEYHYKNPVDLMTLAGAAVKLGINYGDFPGLMQNPCGGGNMNAKGLTPLGRFAIKEMMKRGMIIDIDHMSQKAVDESLAIASGFPASYPLNSGHNDLRDLAEGQHKAENKRTRDQYRRIISTGGMLGIGWSSDAIGFANNYKAIMTETGFRNCGLGTDMNGLVKGPSPRSHYNMSHNPPVWTDSHVVYDSNFQQCCTEINLGIPGVANPKRCWDYNYEGVAHYGLIPDFLKDVQSIGGDQIITTLYHSAEEFAEMWGRCVQVSKQVK